MCLYRKVLGKDMNLSCLKEMNKFVLEFAENTIKAENKLKENIVVNYEHTMPSAYMIAGDLKKILV